MKTTLLIIISLLLFATAYSASAKSKKNVSNKDIDIYGKKSEQEMDKEDADLVAYRNEYHNVKNLARGFQKKKKILGKLKEEAQKLSEEHLEFLAEKKEYEREISKYNTQVECMDVPNKPECNGFNQKSGRDYVKEVAKKIQEKRKVLSECWQSGIESGSSSSGEVNIILKIKSNGRLDHIGYEDLQNFSHKSVLRCTAHVLNRIQFPLTPSGRAVVVRQPINFRALRI